jgi:Nuclease-related domain
LQKNPSQTPWNACKHSIPIDHNDGLSGSNPGSGIAVAALLGLVGASAGAPAVAGLLLLTAVGLGLYARHWLWLARRSRVGARSEDEVQSALAPLQAEGWWLRHSLPWQGRGDIDSVAIGPTGVVVAIGTKTRTSDGRHLARVHQQAVWLSRHRRGWSRRGALAVLCLVRMRGVERFEHDVLVLSIDRLTVALRGAVRMRPPDAITAVDESTALPEPLGRAVAQRGAADALEFVSDRLSRRSVAD